jgi:hypothetical protein
VTNEEKIERFVSAIGKHFYAPKSINQQEANVAKQFDDTNRGALFRNTDKDPNDDKDRDYNGQLNVDGVEYWVSGWVKTSEKVGKYLSLSVKPKDAAKSNKTKPDIDEIPF